MNTKFDPTARSNRNKYEQDWEHLRQQINSMDGGRVSVDVGMLKHLFYWVGPGHKLVAQEEVDDGW